MSHRFALLSITVGSLVLVSLVGCQSASPASMLERGDVVIQPAVLGDASPAAGAQAASVNGAPLVLRGEGRVHILLARQVDLPVEVRQRVRLGAGDALGEQMFERYASLVRSRPRDDERELVAAAEPVSPDAEPSELARLSQAQAWLMPWMQVNALK